ncbi:LemA family protein [uncultured Tessaracoccus sp.]|uniref:LemA family protein n=1 Tax=uncultured Tessaracoccus sp. TaxID=905023 RepID=UPI0026254A60|nr:LemA family protein [uncultured Tessaracoccus sp.]
MESLTQILLGILALIVILAIVVVIWWVSTHNSLVRGRNTIQESWRQIDVELSRRYDLIPNLVETVKGYATHERSTLESVIQHRNQAYAAANAAGHGPSEERAQAESKLSQEVRNLLVTVEAYPEIKANQNFMQLQRQLADTEDRIANSRRFYNANVRDYNTRIESVPSSIVANAGKFEKATYFEIQDPTVREAPRVSFDK